MIVLFLAFVSQGTGQLVRRVDYDAAFALQAGGDIGMLIPAGKKPGVYLRPTGGLKMTFPFTRKWFLGSEINYSELKYRSNYGDAVITAGGIAGRGANSEFSMRRIQVPVYLKYMLSSNRASILFGLFGDYVFDASLKNTYMDEQEGTVVQSGISGSLERWNAGLTVGYEYRIVKHLNLMFRVSAGMKDVMKTDAGFGKKLFPLQAALTLSFDVLRIGDCGCD